MYIRENIVDRKSIEVIEFNSLSEFYKYICDTPFNEAFRWANCQSITSGKEWAGSKNFEEAVNLFKNGWQEMAETLTQKLKTIQNEIQQGTKAKTIYDSAGFQCSVPRYLQGIPTSMINKKNIPIKQKVITINKSVAYCSADSAKEIMEQSIKALQIVKKLESQGYRVNLNIVLGGITKKGVSAKIRIKNANERLNVSKVAFPLVHPSMLRRLYFRFLEVYPGVTKDFVCGYGRPISNSQIKATNKGEYLLPAFIWKDINSISDIEKLDVR